MFDLISASSSFYTFCYRLHNTTESHEEALHPLSHQFSTNSYQIGSFTGKSHFATILLEIGSIMKLPHIPPNIKEIEKDLLEKNPQKIPLIRKEARKTEMEGKYNHWDKLRHLSPPSGLTHEEWWLGIKLFRNGGRKKLPLLDTSGKKPFSFNVPEKVMEQLHQIDLKIGGLHQVPESLTNTAIRDQYLVHSLMQEAISSSQLEGAATTRDIAKEMLKTGRAPRDKNEQMIVNNFLTMQRIQEWKDHPLTSDLIFEMHRGVTDGTLDNPNASGRFRDKKETVVVEDAKTGDILHTPPNASELPKRLQALCDFANGKSPDFFIHPLIRAIILHFWLAYDHPFIDGNGRCARTLFYWYLLKKGYWLFEFLSLSEILLKAPTKYGKAFLYTETDDNDLTYFIIHQSQVIHKALVTLQEYIEKKITEQIEIGEMLKNTPPLNYRQEALLARALKHPTAQYTIEGHRICHQVAYDTARHDLQTLQKLGLLEMRKRGNAFIFQISNDLRSRLRH